jgi:hypothetical protein
MILGCGKMRAHYRTPKPGFVENIGLSGIFYLTLKPVSDFIMAAMSKRTPSKLARLSGVGADTLKRYMRKGLQRASHTTGNAAIKR